MKTIILAGGSGTRLWPLSRELYPKQFLKLFGDTSLFQETIKRALLFSNPDEIYIVSKKEYKFTIANQIEEVEIQIPQENILFEPMGKNTLPAIVLGVKKILEKEDDVISVLPSDHFIVVDDFYIKAFESAEILASNYIVVFGVVPKNPHTGYGYIKPGKILDGGYEVEAFVEKPDMQKAKEYIESGYLWNSGMFIFRPKVFLDELEKHRPQIFNAFKKDDIDEIYANVPKISMDYGIMEKTDRAAVVKFEGTWNDMGTFESLYNHYKKDENGNAIVGKALAVDSKNNLIFGKKLIVTLGMEDTIIVEAGDAILVAKKGLEQRVRDVVNILKEREEERVYHHPTVYRPWGRYTVLEEGTTYKIKEIVIRPGKRISLQRHKFRSEHWIVIDGVARITIGSKVFELKSGESTYVPVGEIHRLENPRDKPLKIIEIQMGSYVGEDDIERFEDDYGRL